MAERNLKATRVALETGIARSTLSSLVNNNSKMIQNETLNTLCSYLKVTPNEFFRFSEFDLIPDVEINTFKTEYYVEGNTWNFSIHPILGDLFINLEKNLNKVSLFELTFNTDVLSVDGFQDQHDKIPRINIRINDSTNKNESLSKFWNDEKLSPFFEIVIFSIYEEFRSKLIKKINENSDFIKSGINIKDIDLIFEKDTLPISNF